MGRLQIVTAWVPFLQQGMLVFYGPFRQPYQPCKSRLCFSLIDVRKLMDEFDLKSPSVTNFSLAGHLLQYVCGLCAHRLHRREQEESPLLLGDDCVHGQHAHLHPQVRGPSGGPFPVLLPALLFNRNNLWYSSSSESSVWFSSR